MDAKNFRTTVMNSFYSNVRNNNEKLIFNEDNDEVIYNILDHFNKTLEKKLDGEYYYRALHLLNNYIVKEKITAREALIILINYIDSDFKIFSIYEEFCNNNIIIKKIKFIFGFYDEKFLKLEKKYLNDNNLLDEYSFVKKMD